jgi:peptidoglycan/LPS O-acetylase OafA/YrhL
VVTYLVAHITLRDSLMRRLLGWAPLVYLGKRSYGAYLIHVLPIHLGYLLFGSTTVASGLLTAAFALAVTIPAAELLYRVVEQPGMALARRLSSAKSE